MPCSHHIIDEQHAQRPWGVVLEEAFRNSEGLHEFPRAAAAHERQPRQRTAERFLSSLRPSSGGKLPADLPLKGQDDPSGLNLPCGS